MVKKKCGKCTWMKPSEFIKGSHYCIIQGVRYPVYADMECEIPNKFKKVKKNGNV